MKKHLKKLRPLLLLTTLFLLTNCQEEFEENKAVVQQKNGSKHTMLTGEAARAKKAELLIKLNKDGGRGLAKLQNVLKGGNTDPAFRQLMDIKEYIDDSEVYSIEQANGNVNNTFRVNMPDAGDNKFYNLVVKTAGTASKAVLLTYNLSKEFAEEYQNGGDILHFSGEIEFDILAIDEDFPCEEEPGKPTPVSGGSGSGGGGGGGGTGGGGTGGGGIGGPGNPGDPGVPYNQSLVDQKFQHMKFMAVINWGGDEEWELVSRSPRYFRTGKVETGDIDNLCGDAEDIGVLNPDKPGEKSLCTELKNKSADANFDAKMNELKAKAASQNFESAYALYQNAGEGLLFSGEATGSATAPEVSLALGQSSTQAAINCIGFMHCHLDNGTTFSVFSFSDIIALATIATISTRPTSELVLYVTTANGTFALKVNDKVALKNNLQRMELGANGYEIRFDQFVKKTDSVEKQTLGFLNFIEDQFSDIGLGAELYQQDNNGDWEKLKLNNSGKKINRTKC